MGGLNKGPITYSSITAKAKAVVGKLAQTKDDGLMKVFNSIGEAAAEGASDVSSAPGSGTGVGRAAALKPRTRPTAGGCCRSSCPPRQGFLSLLVLLLVIVMTVTLWSPTATRCRFRRRLLN